MWNKILEELKNIEGSKFVDAFLGDHIKPLNESENRIVLSTPSQQVIDSIKSFDIIDKIIKIANDINGSDNFTLDFVVTDSQESFDFSSDEPVTKNNKSDKKDDSKYSRLIKDYTFENFVSGPSNEMAFKAIKSAHVDNNKKYNPILVYGDSGLGKTHIIQAAGHYFKSKKKKVCYFSCQQFLNDYVKAIQNSKIEEFKESFLEYDLLLVDDIQFLSKRASTQNEFFYIFNEYLTAQKQVIITSDCYPSEIRDIDNRLITRFLWGANFEITPPEFETRLAIVRKKCDIYKFDIDEDVMIFIASNIKSNVREIEGALKTLHITAGLVDKKIDIDFAKKSLKRMLSSTIQNITVKDIINLTASYLNVKPLDIKSTKRTKQISAARHIAIYLSKQYTDETLKDIGNEFSGRNHTTVLASVNKIESDMTKDKNLKKMIDNLEILIKERKI